VTPGEYKSKGEGLAIAYGFPSHAVWRVSAGGIRARICNLAFVQDGDRAGALDALKARWSQARLVKEAARTGSAGEPGSCLVRRADAIAAGTWF